MRAITGVFPSLAEATCATEKLTAIIGTKHLNLLTPGAPESAVHSVPSTDDMPPVSAALGGVLGGALGVGTALALPGIGAVTAVGLAAAALFGAGAGAVGWKIGDTFDRSFAVGLPADEIYVYEDALRHGHTVVIAMVGAKDNEDPVREVMQQCGAESIDAAREKWWLGLRDAEGEHYGADFERDEPVYRSGFEAALSPHTRGAHFAEAAPVLRERYPREYDAAPFRKGYDRGREHAQRRGAETKP